ncbi:MAG: YHS domain-containing (seleno)protein [Verrucomicrobiota bacterium JB024]|nr:YHS domain-containing (seleno)protein [Verrucomicrobiota bacterium JB024]
MNSFSFSSLTRLSLLFACLAVAIPAQAEDEPVGESTAPSLSEQQRQADFALKGGLALQGYDPVAYFSGQPAKGKPALSTTYKGVTYRFANAENKGIFEKDPARYEPAYGGWCAWAMAEDGSKVSIDPESYKIVDGRLLLFYNGFWADTRKQWNQKAAQGKEPAMLAEADSHWHELVNQP